MPWPWIGFILLVLLLLALDLGVFHRKDHVVGMKEALTWSAVWIGLALAFGMIVYLGYERQWSGLGQRLDAVDGDTIDGHEALVKYLTGYVVEKSLSVDNLFVMAALFAYFGVPRLYQHRVLFWGILGALLMRGAMIGLGATLVARYHWVLYVFGAFLVITGIKMLFTKESTGAGHGGGGKAGNNVVVRWVHRLFPVTEHFHGHHFIVTAGSVASHEARKPGETQEADAAVERVSPGTRMLTPLALALVAVEVTDVIFAVDSIPAIFAITADPLLVFTSNVFAILGLRSLYFALAGMIKKFKYLKVSLAVVLAVVGGKMLAAPWLKDLLGRHFSFYLLGVVLGILVIGVIASVVANRREQAAAAAAAETSGAAAAEERMKTEKHAM
jgi:tellurite resistance protein TerC